jgi:hypothetical protein
MQYCLEKEEAAGALGRIKAELEFTVQSPTFRRSRDALIEPVLIAFGVSNSNTSEAPLL